MFLEILDSECFPCLCQAVVNVPRIIKILFSSYIISELILAAQVYAIISITFKGIICVNANKHKFM